MMHHLDARGKVDMSPCLTKGETSYFPAQNKMPTGSQGLGGGGGGSARKEQGRVTYSSFRAREISGGARTVKTLMRGRSWTQRKASSGGQGTGAKQGDCISQRRRGKKRDLRKMAHTWQECVSVVIVT